VDAFWGAVQEGDEDRARRLLTEWPDFAEEPDFLILAARHGRAAVVADLLAAGAPADSSDELGATPLLAAAQGGHLEITRMLIEAGAPRAQPGLDVGVSAQATIARERLYEAIAAGDADAVRGLLADWPGLARADEALNLAAEHGHAEVVAVLLAAGAGTGVSREQGKTPLAIAAAFDRLAIARMLLEAGGGDPDDALRAAAAAGHVAMAELLLAAGADVDARDPDGRTALWEAAARGAAGVVRLLLSRGTDVEARDAFFRRTPLIQAAHRHDPGSVAALLAAGADPRAVDRAGLSALDYAEHYKQAEIRAALLRALDES
jgi:ankyrin repeat protein